MYIAVVNPWLTIERYPIGNKNCKLFNFIFLMVPSQVHHLTKGGLQEVIDERCT